MTSKPGAKVVELNDKEKFVRREASPGVKLSLKNGPSLVYGREEPPVPEAKDVHSKRRKLSTSMISIRKEKRETATSSGGREEARIKKTETEQIETKLGEEKITTLSEVVKTENIEEMET